MVTHVDGIDHPPAQPNTADLLATALSYAARGWHVFPCHTPVAAGCSCRNSDCERIGKHPRTKNGLNDATTDEPTIRRWWKTWPDANIAVRTGAISGVVILDRDDEKGGDDSLRELERTHGPLLETVQDITGRGMHYVFTHPGTPVKNGVETLGAGLDIRGDGGYVIVPPSLHENGQRYTWELMHHPDETPLAPMPAWLITRCQDTTRHETVDAGAPIPEGQRNDELFKLGCALRRRGFTHAVILVALQEINTTQCQPPLEAFEVERIASSYAKYEAGAVEQDTQRQRQKDPPTPGTPGSVPTREPTANGTQPHNAGIAARRPEVVTMDDVQATPITWLWWPYLALGKLSMLDGDPGIGKSLLMTQLAASHSRGYPLPDQQGKLTLPTGGPQTTLLLSTEDGLADTLKPRLVAAGADCRKVHVFTGWRDQQDAWHAFTLQDLPVLEDAIQRYQPRLVVIDPIQAYLGKIDMHRANETRPLLAELTRLAEQYHCAMVCIRHPSKPGQGIGKVIHRGLGSVDFIGAARTGLFVEQHPTDPGKALLGQSKNNIGPLGRTQLFTKYDGRFEWCGVSRLSAELIGGSGRGPDPTAFLDTVCWLEKRLEGGLAWPAADIEEEGLGEGYKKDTLRRAKKALGVISVKTPGTNDGVWTWRLPSLAHVPPPITTAVTSVSSTSSTSSASSISREQSAESRITGQDTEVTEEREVTEVTEEREVTEVGKREVFEI
jgi:hypothetical protein